MAEDQDKKVNVVRVPSPLFANSTSAIVYEIIVHPFTFSVVSSVPIRLIQTPTRYRMSHRTEGNSAQHRVRCLMAAVEPSNTETPSALSSASARIAAAHSCT
jgi:hypothetical protein